MREGIKQVLGLVNKATKKIKNGNIRGLLELDLAQSGQDYRLCLAYERL